MDACGVKVYVYEINLNLYFISPQYMHCVNTSDMVIQ